MEVMDVSDDHVEAEMGFRAEIEIQEPQHPIAVAEGEEVGLEEGDDSNSNGNDVRGGVGVEVGVNVDVNDDVDVNVNAGINVNVDADASVDVAEGVDAGNNDNNDEDEEEREDAKQCKSTQEGSSENAKRAREEDSDDSDSDSGQTCPICMDVWTNAGEHRLCSLACGHVFGRSCILRWLQTSCTSANRRCPQCNHKARVKDVRLIYAKKLVAVDTTEVEKLRVELDAMTNRRLRLETERVAWNGMRLLYEQQLGDLKARVLELEGLQSELSFRLNRTFHSQSRKFHLERGLDICKDGGCRVLDFNPHTNLLVASQTSSNPLFPGFGIRKVDPEGFQLKHFVQLHYKAIRDVVSHPTLRTTLLSVSLDKAAKLLDLQNNVLLHSYVTDHPLWSCCWSGSNSNVFLVGAANGCITQFDIRNTAGAVNVFENIGDRSPVVSLASIPPNPGRGMPNGGFLACHLNSFYAYEYQDGAYHRKQIFEEGPFVSIRYNEKNHHAIVSARPNNRQPHARHMLCTIDKNEEGNIVCNTLHTFHGGNSLHLLSRPCHVNLESDSLVAAHQESTSSIPLWSVNTGKEMHVLPVSDPVLDMCSFALGTNLFLATLSAKKIRFYNYS